MLLSFPKRVNVERKSHKVREGLFVVSIRSVIHYPPLSSNKEKDYI